MEDADIEGTVDRCRIGWNQVVRYIPLPVAVTVERNAMALDFESLRLSGWEDMDIFGQTQAFGNLAFSVVIAIEKEHRDIGLRQPPHLSDKEQSGLVEIGRASCRERVCKYVSIWVVAD